MGSSENHAGTQIAIHHASAAYICTLIQKTANKEYKLLSQQDDTDGEVDVGNIEAEAASAAILNDAGGDEDDDDDGDEDQDDGEYDASTKKVKSPNAELANLLNTRLQKLITKAPKECEGRLLSYGCLLMIISQPWRWVDI